MRGYHVGFLKQGSTLIIECADTIDQLSCELWRYYGVRDTTVARLRQEAPLHLADINRDLGTAFTWVLVRRAGTRDYTAGHGSTLPGEMAESIAGGALGART